jgi:hypothetical protein
MDVVTSSGGDAGNSAAPSNTYDSICERALVSLYIAFLIESVSELIWY